MFSSLNFSLIKCHIYKKISVIIILYGVQDISMLMIYVHVEMFCYTFQLTGIPWCSFSESVMRNQRCTRQDAYKGVQETLKYAPDRAGGGGRKK